jgi:hypothetical protein
MQTNFAPEGKTTGKAHALQTPYKPAGVCFAFWRKRF